MMKNVVFLAAISAAFVAVGAIDNTTEDKTALGDWEITVATGDSNVVTVAQSGSGKIIKKGGGHLVLRKNSTFTGGVELQEGFLMVDPDADAGTSGIVNCTALGTGDVTILGQRSDYTGYCELGIVGAGPNDTRIVTVANNIHVTGDTTGKYPALFIYGQKSVLTGKITANQNFYFCDDEITTRAIHNAVSSRKEVLSCTFGEVEVAGEIRNQGFCRFEFTGKVTAQKINFNVARPQRSGEQDPDQNNAHSSFVLYAPSNSVGEIIGGRHPIYCAVKDALPGMLFRSTRTKGLTQSYLNLFGYSPNTGYDQSIGGLASDHRYTGEKSGSTAYTWGVNGRSSKTLTITGIAPNEGETEKELVTCATIGTSDYPDFNLTLDAYDGFTQTISNQNHYISNALRAKKGTLRVAGTATMSSLKSIMVDSGAVFDVRVTSTNAFAALTSLAVDGTFNVAPCATNAFEDSVVIDMTLGANASLSLPSGMNLTVRTLVVNGGIKLPGTYTSAEIPAISEGASVIVLLTPAGAAAEWTGAADSDNLMTTMANWKDTPELIDFSQYLTAVTITNNGTEMVYADGTKINKLLFRRTPAAVPFTIRPTTPGAVLEVAGRIEMLDAAQLIIKDAVIAPPNHIDQGRASNLDTAMYVSFQGNSAVTTYAASNNVYKTSKNNLPLILDNAVIEKPLCMTAHITGHACIYCMPGTTNEIKGNFNHITYQPDVHVPANTLLTFSGGVSYGTCMHKMLTGTMAVKDKPITSTTYFLLENGTLVLDAENMSLRGSGTGDGMNLSGGTLDCRRSFCFNGESMLCMRGTSLCMVEFNATTQRVTRLCCYNSKSTSKIHGDPGSLLEVVGGWGSGRTAPNKDLSATYRLLTNRVDIAGALSLKMSATNETMTFCSKAFSTCGDLEVSAGTLDFMSNATWLKGTNVAVNGEGRLKVAKGGTFNLKSELSLADGGVFEIPSGESQIFNYVTTNGVLVSSGRYTSLPNGEGDFLAGGGEIVIRRKGIIISLQ